MSHRKIGSFTVGDPCVKVYRDSDWDQYICKPFIDGKMEPEIRWYFTQYRDDAISTSRNIAYQMAQNQKSIARQLEAATKEGF